VIHFLVRHASHGVPGDGAAVEQHAPLIVRF